MLRCHERACPSYARILILNKEEINEKALEVLRSRGSAN